MPERIIQLNEGIIKNKLKELVRNSVEETLNKVLEEEAQALTQTARYERTEARQGTINAICPQPPVTWN